MNVKKYIFILALFISYQATSQVGIGRIPRESTLLDFIEDATNKRGVILPVVTIDSINIPYASGTFIVDTNDKKVKVRLNNKWQALTDVGSFDAQFMGNDAYTTPVSFLTPTLPENSSQKIIIGNKNSAIEGLMVLDAPDKAFILPKISSPHSSVAKPVAGMICYDTDAKAIAVFDGKVWSYWK